MARIKPGDLIGFSSCDPLGLLINVATLGVPFRHLSHVAIVAAHPATGRSVLFESTSLYHVPCMIQGRIVQGVQAHRVFARVRDYWGRAYHYPLTKPLTNGESALLTGYCRLMLGCQYDYLGTLNATGLALGWLSRLLVRENLHRVYCSEFVAAALRHCGRLHTENCSVLSPNALARLCVARGIHQRPVRLT